MQLPTKHTDTPNHKPAEYWRLFVSFVKIGMFTLGGGYAMLPLIERETIDHRGWIDRDEFIELLGLAQSAPGPVSLNTAVFVGYKVCGYGGALAAITGVVMPPFVIILLVALYFSGIRDNRYVEAAFKGIRPAVVALIAAPVINMIRRMKYAETAVAILSGVAVSLLGISPIWFIIAGAGVGIAMFARRPEQSDPEQSDGDTLTENNTEEQQ